jgi:hypothetical protein
MSSSLSRFSNIMVGSRRTSSGDSLHFKPWAPHFTRFRVVVGLDPNGGFAGDGGTATVSGVTGSADVIVEGDFGKNIRIGNAPIPKLTSGNTSVAWTPDFLSNQGIGEVGSPVFVRVDQYDSVSTTWIYGQTLSILAPRLLNPMMALIGDAPVDPSFVEGQSLPKGKGIAFIPPHIPEGTYIKNTGSNGLLFALNGGTCFSLAAGADIEFDAARPRIIQVGCTGATSYQIIVTR